MTRTIPEIIDVNSQQLEELLARAESNTLREEDTQLMRQIFDSYVHFFQIVGDKNTTIARLRKLLFGAASEKTEKIVGAQDPEACQAPTELACHEPNCGEATDDQATPGHGRYGADDYPGARQVEIPHPTLRAGDDCPLCHQGTLYEKTPSVFVRFVGHAPLQATVYRLQRLRCHLCDKVFTAPAPEEMGAHKYDHTAASGTGRKTQELSNLRQA